MKLNDLCWPEAQTALANGTPVILPLGSLEQHGPHLPFDTDTVCVQAVVDGAAERADSISLPALSYGAPSRPRSGGGPVFPMGAEISLDVYYQAVRSVMTNLLQRGVTNLLVTTWHTENGVVIYDAAREAAKLAGGDKKIVVVDSPGNLVRPETSERAYVDGPMAGEFEHAGLIETSVMLALQPERVQPFVDVEARLPSLPYDVVPAPDGAVAPSGSFTSPRNATAEIGQMLLDDIVPGLAAVIEGEFSSRR